jgi:glucose-6-phosphate dehydrogenase assembly protein OpcA
MIVDSSRSPEPRSMLQQLAEAVQSGRIVADLSWARLSRWREMIALAFETPECRGRRQGFSGIHVSYAGGAVPVTAYYMAGWLAFTLGWPAGDSRLSLAAADGGVSGLQSVVLTSPGMEVSIRRRGEHEVEVRVNELIQPTILPPDADSAVLGEELSISGRDPVFEAALAAADRIAQSARS